jgi:hypothetical protein
MYLINPAALGESLLSLYPKRKQTEFPKRFFWLFRISDGLENRDYGRRDSSRWPCGTLYQQKLALTLLTSGGLSVGIVHSRTQATEFSCFI